MFKVKEILSDLQVKSGFRLFTLYFTDHKIYLIETDRITTVRDGAPSVTELEDKTHHVQGIVVDGDVLWVSSVFRKQRSGHLHKFHLRSGKHIASVEIHDGDRYHPGGMDHDGSEIIVPVAEYRPKSSTVVLRIDKASMKPVGRFTFDDHIGCLAVAEDRLIGGNWDARVFYSWDAKGKLIRQRANPTRVAYQDIKWSDGALLASGNLSREQGAVDWLDPATLKLRKRIIGGKTDRGIRFMNEGMAVVDNKLYLLPEDGPSRLFIYQL
jgi:hypothetical protein